MSEQSQAISRQAYKTHFIGGVDVARSVTQSFWLNWAILNGIAGAIVGALEATGLQFTATLLLTGLCLGTAQWLILRNYLRRSSRWIVVSTVAWVIGIQLVISLSPLIDPTISFLTRLGAWEVFWLNLIQQPLCLLILGTAQGFILHQLHRPTRDSVMTWVAGSAIGGLLQGGMSAASCAAICPALTQIGQAAFATAVVYGIGWISYGVITGIVMQHLLQNRSMEAR